MSEKDFDRLKEVYSYVTGCLICETCSLKDKPVYMEPEGHNMLWRCPKCNYLVMVLLEFHAGRNASHSLNKKHENDKYGWEKYKVGNFD